MIIATISCFFSLGLANAQKAGEQNKPAAYFDATDPSSEDQEVKRTFADKFRIVEIKKSDGFTPARVKGEWLGGDPYFYGVAHGSQGPAKFLVALLITVDGHAADLHFMESADKGFEGRILRALASQRFAPARLRGVPVLSIRSRQFMFPVAKTHDQGLGREGLGLLGHGNR